MQTEETQPQQCAKLPGVSCVLGDVPTGAKFIRHLTQCSRCGWVDPAALDRWAESAAKEQLTTRAQNIAVAAEIEPFSFVVRPGEPLSLEEAIGQAMGAVSMCWNPRPTGEFDSSRAKVVYDALIAEVQAALDKAWSSGVIAESSAGFS
jgi:hypothetical protein